MINVCIPVLDYNQRLCYKNASYDLIYAKSRQIRSILLIAETNVEGGNQIILISILIYISNANCFNYV